MKYLVLVTTFLCCAVASAMPKIGDYVNLNLTLNNAPVGTLEEELIQFDATKNQFLQQNTQTLSGTREVSTQWTNGVTDAQIAAIVSGCAQYGGVAQNITEPAGTFATCALPVNDNGTTGTMWIGAVPMGVVKLDITSGSNHIIGDVASFRLGQ
jgi:hypothetical protein